MRTLAKGLPSRVPSQLDLEQVSIGGVRAERGEQRGAEPECFLLYIHGGGYVAGGIESQRDAVSTITLAAGQYYAEIDGIGKPDVYSDYGSVGQYTITLLPPCLCVADIDGDGNGGIQDFLDLLAAWGPCLGCPADLNGDGTVGIDDFLDLLAAWGPC